MKKYLSLVLILLVMVVPLMGVDAKKNTTTTTTAAGKKVNFYVFYSETCSVCASLHQYIETTLSKDKAHNYMYELVDLEASSTVNSQLMTLVSDKFNLSEDSRGRVPLIVIGEQYFLGFSLESSPEKIVSAIEKAYKEEQEDIVAGLADGSITVADKDLKEAETDSDTTGIIILAIIGIILIAIVYSRGKTKEV